MFRLREKHSEYKEYAAPIYDDIIDKIWMVGDDLGDLLYFYGERKEGFGLYVADAGVLLLDDADKIADSLTDLLVHEVGIDTAVWNMIADCSR